uniref:Uncharacterized protein n=1 Tax=Haliea sp. ETY-M TaxID=1055105 RepID=A0A455R347_9GAMM|nr:hypothetical protein [Haliea sp. ETY-M]
MEEDNCAAWIRGDKPGKAHKVHIALYQPGAETARDVGDGAYEEMCREVRYPGETVIVFDIVSHELRERTFNIEIGPAPDQDESDLAGGAGDSFLADNYTFFSVPNGTMQVTKQLTAGMYQIELAVEDFSTPAVFDFVVGSEAGDGPSLDLSPNALFMAILGVLIVLAILAGRGRGSGDAA